MSPLATPMPLVFALTPRMGELNHRYLVSATSPPDERDVDAAFKRREFERQEKSGSSGTLEEKDDILAVKVDVPQKSGRPGEEWLIVRDQRIDKLPPDRKDAVRAIMRQCLAGLTPPHTIEAPSSSMLVPFDAIDDIARRIVPELGVHTTRRSFLMPIALAGCTVLLGGGLLLMSLFSGANDPPPPRGPQITPPSLQRLLSSLGDDSQDETTAVTHLRKKLIPGIPPDATLLDALNYLRPEIAQAANEDYKTHGDAVKDNAMLHAVRATLVDDAGDAFVAESERPKLRDLEPKGFRRLYDKLVAWPDHDVGAERPQYREIERTFFDSSKAAKVRSSGDEPRIVGVFTYQDAKERLPVLLSLFERRSDGDLTELGRRLLEDSQPRPATLAGWLRAAVRAHNAADANANVWLSHQALSLHRRQAVDFGGKSTDSANFYEQLDEFLQLCEDALRSEPAATPAG